MEYPRSRSEAVEQGATYYFTGRPCKHGHVALRLAKGVCVECRKIEQKRSSEKRRGKPKSNAAKASARRYYERNKEAVKAKANNQPPEKRREYRRRWKENNPDVVRAHIAQKRRRLRTATPRLLSQKHRKQIRDLFIVAYTLSRNTGVTYSVDHIIPLVGDGICGLHVPWNLQVIPLLENCRKGTRWEGDSQTVAPVI